MARSYSENLAASNNDPDKMRKNAAKFDSIKGPQIVPVPSVMHIVPPGLHITLLMVPAAIVLLQGLCDVLDEDVDEAVLAKVADILDVGDEPSGEEDEEIDEAAAAATSSSTASPRVRSGYSETRVKLEKEAQEAMLKVLQADLQVQQANKEVLQRMNTLRRVQVNLEADNLKREGNITEAKAKWKEMELIARGENKNKRFRETFRFCSKVCLQTGHDHHIEEQICSSCNLSCHHQCELWDALEAATPPAPAVVPEGEVESGSESDDGSREDKVAAAGVQEELNTCRDCRERQRLNTFTNYQEMKMVVLPWLEAGKAKLLTDQVALERARAEEQVKNQELKNLVGDRRRELVRILEEELHVVKTAYQGGTYVGNHCHKMLMHHEELSKVIASTSRPELQVNFNLFCSTYLRIHHTMKAARWLTEEEVRASTRVCL